MSQVTKRTSHQKLLLPNKTAAFRNTRKSEPGGTTWRTPCGIGAVEVVPADGGGDAVLVVVLYGRAPLGGGGDPARPIGRAAGRPATMKPNESRYSICSPRA